MFLRIRKRFLQWIDCQNGNHAFAFTHIGNVESDVCTHCGHTAPHTHVYTQWEIIACKSAQMGRLSLSADYLFERSCTLCSHKEEQYNVATKEAAEMIRVHEHYRMENVAASKYLMRQQHSRFIRSLRRF